MRDPATDLAIEATGLVKTFGETRALDGIDLAVPAGTVYGLLGPNGAGKTTAVRVLATLLRPDGGAGPGVRPRRGRARPTRSAARVSLTGQYASVDEDLTGHGEPGPARPAARATASRPPATGPAQLLAAFGLTDAADRQVKKYSGGMRRRLDIAASILNTPDLLFLDEPTTGLDPRSRNQVWEIIRAVVAHGTTVLLTTQYLDEADQLAGRIAVIDHGKVIAEGTPGELKSSVGAGTVHLRLRDAGQRAGGRAGAGRGAGRAGAARRRPGRPDRPGRPATAPTSRRSEQASRALAQLADAGIVVDDFSLGQPSLDEVFLALTDRPAASDEDVDDELEASDEHRHRRPPRPTPPSTSRRPRRWAPCSRPARDRRGRARCRRR